MVWHVLSIMGVRIEQTVEAHQKTTPMLQNEISTMREIPQVDLYLEIAHMLMLGIKPSSILAHPGFHSLMRDIPDWQRKSIRRVTFCLWDV